jgi:signal transduction histidine kinase
VTHRAIDLQSLHAVATATMSPTGTLIDANTGFMRMIDASLPIGRNIGHCFIQPNLAALLDKEPDPSGMIYRGLLTIGDERDATWTLHASVWREAGQIRLLAEHDILGLERLNHAILALNSDYAKIQFDLAQAQTTLKQINVELERRVEERTHTLRDALIRAEAADLAKSVFLATVSHELRTPLNHIIGFSEVILSDESGELPPVQRRQISIIRKSGEQLFNIVQDMIDLSSVGADDLLVQASAIELGPELESQRLSFIEQAQQRSLNLEAVDCAPSIFVHADRARLSQVLRHLLGNAIKFTDHGCVSIRAFVVDGMARIEVEDTGIGISPAGQAELFTSFQQVTNLPGRLNAGMGMGLAIVKRVVDAMGGTVGVASVPAKGSVFWFTLPLAG